MPLGLSSAPTTFKRLINCVFQEALDHFCTVYLDDILIYSSSTVEHLQHIEWVLSKLRSNSLFAKTTKCDFDLTKLENLDISSQVAWSNPILRKLKQFNSGLLPSMSKNCKYSLVSSTTMVALCAILWTSLPLFMFYFAKRFLGIGMTLRSLLYASCACIMQLSCSCHARLYKAIFH